MRCVRVTTRVFNILHGQHGGGEDGVLQGALESLRVPYTGSGVLGSALSMDKVRTKQVWIAEGLPTPRFVALRKRDGAGDVHAAAAKLGLPVIVKPACEGSSVGVSRVLRESDLDAAAQLAARYPGDLLVEEMIVGQELTVAILGREALPSIRIVPKASSTITTRSTSPRTRNTCVPDSTATPRTKSARSR
jgi:D-alanine-D-alanine ligase